MSADPVILVANDDGYRAPGVRTLARIARALASQVFIVAPDREQSAASHALTLHRPLRVEPEGPNVWAVDGTPTDCVHLALRANFLPAVPTLLLSGINHGGNLGDEITYSGTVAAAMEGTLLGLPSIAFSCISRDFAHDELDALQPWIERIVHAVLERGLPRNTLLNVNFPDPRRGPIRGIKATRQGNLTYGAQVVQKTDPRHRTYYWIGGDVIDTEQPADSDVDAVAAGYVSVTPIHLNLTDERMLSELSTWPLDAVK